MDYFKIKNWDKYQHRDALRGDGPMKFIRMDVAMIWDQKLHKLTPNQQLTWYKLLLYSGQTRNKLEYNSAFLKQVLMLNRKPNLALYEDLGLIERIDASNLRASLPAKCQPRVEKSRVEKSREEKKLASLTSVSPVQIFDLWNLRKSKHQPEAKKLTKARQAKIKQRVQEFPDLEFWQQLVDYLSHSSWHNGQNDRNWVADFDFLISPSVALKFFEKKLAGQNGPDMKIKQAIKIGSREPGLRSEDVFGMDKPGLVQDS